MWAFGAVWYISKRDWDHQRRVGEASGVAQSVPCKNDTSECKR